MHARRQPVHLVPVWKPIANVFFAGCAALPRRFHGAIDLRQRQPGVIEKGLAAAVSSTPLNAARQQLGPDLVLQVANLPAQ